MNNITQRLRSQLRKDFQLLFGQSLSDHTIVFDFPSFQSGIDAYPDISVKALTGTVDLVRFPWRFHRRLHARSPGFKKLNSQTTLRTTAVRTTYTFRACPGLAMGSAVHTRRACARTIIVTRTRHLHVHGRYRGNHYGGVYGFKNRFRNRLPSRARARG